MRILVVAPMPPDARGRGAIPLVLHAQVRGLSARHEVVVATVGGMGAGEREALAGAGVEVHAVARGAPAGPARWRRRGRLASTWLRGREPWRTAWFWEPELQRTIDALLGSRRFDVVAVEDNAMGICRLPPDVPAVLTEHEVRRPRAICWHPGPPAQWGRWALREADWRRWPSYQRSVWARFDRVQVFAGRDAETLRTIAPALAPRVRVTPFGIEVPEEAPPRQEEAGRAIFVGNFSHPPNVDAAQWLRRDILPALRSRCPDARLTIAGSEAPPEVRALAGDGVEVLTDLAEVEPLVQRAAVVLAPLRIGGGMRMKVLHAMALGKAVVTTPRGIDGLADVAGRPPAAVAEDAAGLAASAASLLTDDPARRELGRRARAHVARHFSADAYAGRLEAVYREAIEERR